MVKRVLVVSVLVVAGYLAVTANLGERTLYGHMLNIWDSDEMVEMRDDLTKLDPTSLAAQHSSPASQPSE